MTIGPEFHGARGSIQAFEAMDRMNQQARAKDLVLKTHAQAIKQLDGLERWVLKNKLFKDFSSLYQKGTEILTGKYHKKDEAVHIDNIYYLAVEGTGRYQEKGVFNDGLIVEGSVGSNEYDRDKKVEYLNDGFGERSYEINWTIFPKRLFSPIKLELQIPIEDGTKDKLTGWQRVVMTKTDDWMGSASRKGPKYLEYYQGKIEKIDSYGGAKITLVTVVDKRLVANFKSWQEDKENLKKLANLDEIKRIQMLRHDVHALEDAKDILKTLELYQNTINKSTEMTNLIKAATELARFRGTTGLPVDHEVTEEITKKRQKAVTK